MRFHDMVLRAPGMLALHTALDAVEQPARYMGLTTKVSAYDMGRHGAAVLGHSARSPSGAFDLDVRRLSSLRWTRGGGVEPVSPTATPCWWL